VPSQAASVGPVTASSRFSASNRAVSCGARTGEAVSLRRAIEERLPIQVPGFARRNGTFGWRLADPSPPPTGPQAQAFEVGQPGTCGTPLHRGALSGSRHSVCVRPRLHRRLRAPLRGPAPGNVRSESSEDCTSSYHVPCQLPQRERLVPGLDCPP